MDKLWSINGILEDAKKTSENRDADSSNGKSYIKTVYPAKGSGLAIRLLYNPKSNKYARILRQHKVGKDKYPCLKMYDNSDCPICKVIDELIMDGYEPDWRLKQMRSGLSFAQFVGCDNNYEWNNDKYKPQRGELILVDYRYKVYEMINDIILRAGESAVQILTDNEAVPIYISSKKEGGDNYTFSAMADSLNKKFKSKDTDEEFKDWLNNMDDLMEQKFPKSKDQLDSKILEGMVKVANELNVRYRGQSNDVISNVETKPTSFSESMKEGKPKCFTRYNEASSECITCDFEAECMSVSNNDLPF
jgi:hypothetical protein